MSAPDVRAAPPYVQWSTRSATTVTTDQWQVIFPSMQALKGHVQEYPGCQKLEAFVEDVAGGSVYVICITTWDTPESRDAFLERGYTFERMVADVVGVETEPTRLLERIF